MNARTDGMTGFLGLDKPFNDITQLQAGILGFDQMKETEVFFSEPEKQEAKQYKGIYNMNRKKLEAIVTKDYKLLQHTEAFVPLIEVLKNFGLTDIEGAYGCTGKKAMAVINFKDPRLTVDVKGDIIRLSLYIKHGVDGKLALWGTLGGFRLVCSNGMVIGEIIGQERQVHMGQETSADRIPEFYRSLIQQGIDNSNKLSAVIEEAMAEMVEDTVMEAMLYGIGLGKRYVESILLKCQDLDVKNKWNIYNAVTEFITHTVRRASFNSRLDNLKKANKVLTVETKELVKAGREAMKGEQE